MKGHFSFGTKAETLERLKPLVTHSIVPDLLHFTIRQWDNNPEDMLKSIQDVFKGARVIVRSSARAEDSDHTAMAGIHDSVFDVDTGCVDSLSRAINEVGLSYHKSGHNNSVEDQILIQVLVSDVSMSGVVFTQDMNTGAPYYVINYDDESGRTDVVTAGKENSNRTLLVHRDSVTLLRSDRFRALLLAVQEIEQVTGYDSLDIEFAVGTNNKVYLLQTRKITTRPNWNRGITLRVNDAVQRLGQFIRERNKPVPGWFGKRSILGQMPDWNPAEMIGTAPRPLAFSLYRHLITDRIWREARRQMGYAEPRGASLMVSLAGRPYIDVRLSFHSYLPMTLNPDIGHKLVDAWLDCLFDNRELHDKVEFDVATTILAFDFDSTVKDRLPGVLSSHELAEYKQCLGDLTQSLISGKTASIDGELHKIDQLKKRRKSCLKNGHQPDLDVASALLEDCARLGTLPFSILARHGFIANAFLKALLHHGVFSQSDVDHFQRSIQTVAGDLAIDVEGLKQGNIDERRFIELYGHLRPGTYDILSFRYDQREGFVDRLMQEPPVQMPQIEPFALTDSHARAIDELLEMYGFSITAHELIDYIKRATIAREYAKFEFSKNISDALEIITNWGENVGLSRDELSYLSIRDILDASITAMGRTLEQHLRDLSLQGRSDYEITAALHLPHIVAEPVDVQVVPLVVARPNFITQSTVHGPSIFLSGHDIKPPDISGKIVLIESADPGFDWIFSHALLGLVTKYGGVNSHMAIRCAEFGLPAAIGCGEQIFDRISRARAVEINCVEGRIAPLEG